MACIHHYSRDNARTPFRWENAPNGGFSQGRPWLGVNSNYTEINAADQQKDSASLYHWYQKLVNLRLRSEYSDVLTDGNFVPIYEGIENLLAYERSYEGRMLRILCNYQQKECTVTSDGDDCFVADNYGNMQKREDVLTLRAFEVLILESRAYGKPK